MSRRAVRLLAIAALALCAGCAYYNALYNARESATPNVVGRDR